MSMGTRLLHCTLFGMVVGWNEIRERRVVTTVYHKYFKHFVEPASLNTPDKLHRIC